MYPQLNLSLSVAASVHYFNALYMHTQSTVRKSACSLRTIRGRVKESCVLPRVVLWNVYAAIPRKTVSYL